VSNNNGYNTINVSKGYDHMELVREISKSIQEGQDTAVIGIVLLSQKKRMAILRDVRKRCGDGHKYMCRIEIGDVHFQQGNPYPTLKPEMLDILKTFSTPQYYEGWDDIIIDYPCHLTHSFTPSYFKTFPQDNSHHSLTLGEHCWATHQYILDKYINKELRHLDHDIVYNLLVAAKYHDIGKVLCKFFKEGDPNAKFYGHQNVGAYLVMIDGNIPEDIRPEVSDLVHHHMALRNPSEAKKIARRVGPEKYSLLELLREADVAAR